MSPTPANYRVLYTKHVRQKRKVFHDGFLTLSGNQSAELLDEEGKLVTSARLSTSQQITSTSEGLTCFSGYLVNCDEECDQEDIPKSVRSENPEHSISKKTVQTSCDQSEEINGDFGLRHQGCIQSKHSRLGSNQGDIEIPWQGKSIPKVTLEQPKLHLQNRGGKKFNLGGYRRQNFVAPGGENQVALSPTSA